MVLLCSDGLTSMISEERVKAILAEHDNLDAAADALIDEANEAGGRDNITVVLFRLEEVGADDAAGEETMVGVSAPGDALARRNEEPAPLCRDRRGRGAAAHALGRAAASRRPGRRGGAPPPAAGRRRPVRPRTPVRHADRGAAGHADRRRS